MNTPKKYTVYDLPVMRRKLRITQAKLADLVGVTPNTIARWERGVMCPNRFALERAIQILLRLARKNN